MIFLNQQFKKSSRRFFSPSLACLQNAVARYCLVSGKMECVQDSSYENYFPCQKETYWFDACVEHMTEGCLPVAEMR